MSRGHKHSVLIQFGRDPEPGDKPKEFTFATKAELDAFMEGVEETSGWLEHTVIDDSRDAPEPRPTHWMVCFYKDVTTRDHHAIIVRADSPEEARAKVEEWGRTGDGLTDAEEATENLLKEGEVVEGRFYGLEDPDAFAAVMAADAD